MISLFVPEGDRLRCILKNYEINTYNGEWDMDCAGDFTEEDKTFAMSSSMTDGYFNIQVRGITKHKIKKKVGDDCVEKEKVTTELETLKYRNGLYQ